LGMVNQAVARDDLLPTALAMAERIAKKPLFALKMTKEAVNQPRTPRAVPAPWRGSLLCISCAIATTSPCGLKKALAAGWRGPDPRLDHPKIGRPESRAAHWYQVARPNRPTMPGSCGRQATHHHLHFVSASGLAERGSARRLLQLKCVPPSDHAARFFFNLMESCNSFRPYIGRVHSRRTANAGRRGG